MDKQPGKLFHPFLHVGHLIESLLRDRLNETGLGPRQARVLSALNRMGVINQKTLASEFGITPASMSTMCNRLASVGLIKRKIDPDEKRAFLILLTPEGENKVKFVRNAWRDIDRLIIDAIGQEDAEMLGRISSELRNQIGGRIPGGDMKDDYNG